MNAKPPEASSETTPQPVPDGAARMKRWMAVQVAGVEVALRCGLDPKFGLIWQPAYQRHPFNPNAMLPAGWVLSTPSGQAAFTTPTAQRIEDPLAAIEAFKAHILAQTTPSPESSP